ncbi:HAD family phosphatase [Candidatus Woesearchaeota archaeon]|nr:HAD family phosphatase [Candidatus Woesearchaeota archaeon]
MIKAVIFDLWKTLGTKSTSFSGKFCEHFCIRKTPQFMPHSEASVQLRRWKTMENMAKGMLRYFSLPVTPANVRFIVRIVRDGEKGSRLYPGMKKLLADIHKTCRLGVLSNTTVFETHFLREWGVEQQFDAVVYSWQIRSLKPSPKNFRHVMKKLGVKPSECVFVDDNPKNRSEAKKLGMHALNVANTAKLRKELRRLGVRV